MKKLLTVLVAGVVVAFASGAANADLLIDDFSTLQKLTANAGGSPDFSSVSAPMGILGGVRDALVEWKSGENDATVEMNAGGSELLNFSAGADTRGIAELQWDGNDGDALNVDPTGLNHVDLTDGGALDALGLRVVFSDLSADLVLTVWTDANNWSSYSLATVAGTGAGNPAYNEIMPFAAFTIGGGTGADFGNVGAIALNINPSYNATDLQIDFLESTKVPEPGTMILGAMGLGLVALRRRR